MERDIIHTRGSQLGGTSTKRTLSIPGDILVVTACRVGDGDCPTGILHVEARDASKQPQYLAPPSQQSII